jgi:hypothetical protein
MIRGIVPPVGAETRARGEGRDGGRRERRGGGRARFRPRLGLAAGLVAAERRASLGGSVRCGARREGERLEWVREGGEE